VWPSAGLSAPSSALLSFRQPNQIAPRSIPHHYYFHLLACGGMRRILIIGGGRNLFFAAVRELN
jgi:hypothetical protein